MRLWLLLPGLVLVAVAGCGVAAVPAPTAVSSTGPAVTGSSAVTRVPGAPARSRSGPGVLAVSSASASRVQAQPAAGSCRARGVGELSLPDPGCIPGATNPKVTQATIASTICVAGYPRTIRPARSITGPEKRASMAAYGDPHSPGLFEYDHLVALELGGAANDPRNLWPEPGASPNTKDTLEDALHDLVCAHRLTLVRAQQLIAGNWVTGYRQILGTPAPVNATAAAVADGVAAGDLVPAAAWRAARRSTGGLMLRTAAAPTVPVMLSSAALGVRVRLRPGRLWLGWPPPVGTVVEPALGDLFGGDPAAPSPISGDPGDVDRVAVCWDGHHQVEWVDPADLVSAAAVVAVA